MSSILIDAQRITRRHGDRTIFSDLDLRVAGGDRIAIVGDNGSGKSTLLAILAGRDAPDSGRVERFCTLAYLPQLGRHGEGGGTSALGAPPTGVTVRDAALEALGVGAATRALERAEAQLEASGHQHAITEHAAALERWLAAGGASADSDVEAAAARVGFPSELLDRPRSTLSSGQGVRAALLPLAAREHDAVLLDEPTNHLDADGRELLTALLAQHRGALVVASHDRAFLAEHVRRIVALDPRGGPATSYSGGWEAYEREEKAARQRAEVAYEQATARRAELVEAEREIRRRAAATRSKLASGAVRDPDKHHREWYSARADGVAARGRVVGRRAERVDVPDKPWQERPLALALTAAEQRSALVVGISGAAVVRGAWTSPTFEFAVASGERVLLRGPNGSGKSTLLEALAGTIPLDAGTRTVGPTAVVSVLGAVESALQSEAPVVQVVRHLTGLDPAEVRGRLANAGVSAELAARPASTLSPGERTRAELAVVGARRTTCLLLDEPSNHLDLRSQQALEAALDGWPGALVVATHDERLASRLRPTREVLL